VTGTTATGFHLEFLRNYNFLSTLRRYQAIPLAQVNEKYIANTVGNGKRSQDTIARDRLESAATVVPPPDPSPNPFDPSVGPPDGITMPFINQRDSLLIAKPGCKPTSRN
jgi:hypothetical protein